MHAVLNVILKRVGVNPYVNAHTHRMKRETENGCRPEQREAFQ